MGLQINMDNPAMPKQENYPLWQYTLDATAIIVFLGYGVCYVHSLIVNYALLPEYAIPKWLELILYALLAYVMADIVSGTFHFLADNFGSPQTPIVGKVFIRAFREHHSDPLGITRHGYVETNGANCLISLPLLIGFYHATEPLADYRLRFSLLIFFMAIFLTNQLHKWAHAEAPPRLAVYLQNMRLVLHPAHHAKHHRPPFDKNYCITCGWMNPVLEYLRVFQGIKRLFKT